METPAEIEFVGIEPDESVQAEIGRHIAQLEKRFGRITSCRLVVRAPGEHHKNGSRYEIKIFLALPGHRDVNVDNGSKDPQRATDLKTALNDSFKRARRQLQDRVRKMERLVKRHEPAPIGTIARIDPSGEFGFIETADGREVYFHKNSVLNGGFARLKPGAAVSFAEEEGEKGAQASTVKPTSRRPTVREV
jgi:cold shock CspA family protein/ribosome-associated translation inhibitor RaiA